MHPSKSDRSKHVALAIGALALLLAGCQPAPKSSISPQQVAESYYQAIKNKDLETAAGFFATTQIQPREFWVDRLQAHREALGDLESFEIRDTNVNTVYSGVRSSIRVNTKYTKHPATETLIVFEDVQGNPPRVEAVSVVSPGMRR